MIESLDYKKWAWYYCCLCHQKYDRTRKATCLVELLGGKDEDKPWPLCSECLLGLVHMYFVEKKNLEHQTNVNFLFIDHDNQKITSSCIYGTFNKEGEWFHNPFLAEEHRISEDRLKEAWDDWKNKTGKFNHQTLARGEDEDDELDSLLS